MCTVPLILSVFITSIKEMEQEFQDYFTVNIQIFFLYSRPILYYISSANTLVLEMLPAK